MTPTNDDLAAQLKAEAISARRAARAPWKNAHVDRLIREREARETSKEYRQAERIAALTAQPDKLCTSCRQRRPLDCFSPSLRHKSTARCKRCNADNAKRVYQRKRGAFAARGSVSTERQQQITERVDYLAALLADAVPGQRINDEESWDTALSELTFLWIQSGDKTCIACGSVVPPTKMLPPGPANFYPGKCRSCSSAEYRSHVLRVFGRVTEGPRLIPMRDGSRITLGELARRHRERAKAVRQT